MESKSLSQLKSALEAILFLADEPISAGKLAGVLEEDQTRVMQALEGLQKDLELGSRGLVLRELAGGFRLYTHPAYQEEVDRFANQGFKKLTKASLEVLAIAAYRQPISRAEITALRGVNSDGVVSTLLERGLLRKIEKAPLPGAPQLLGITKAFLEKAGLRSLDDLPPLEEFSEASEIIKTEEAVEMAESPEVTETINS